MFTTNFKLNGSWIKKVNNRKPSEHLRKVRIPPAWTEVQLNTDSNSNVIAIGYDAAGRQQRLYSADHVAKSKDDKFVKVRKLLEEWNDIRTEIEETLNDPHTSRKDKEAYLVAYLIFETGIRPGSNTETMAAVQSFGATTLQLRHVKLCDRGVRLQFIGKKGVKQNILVTNPYLVEIIHRRKNATSSYSVKLFNVSGSKLRQVFKELGSGAYSPKDFRTAVGTSIAYSILGERKRWPITNAKRKALVNRTLDAVAKQLGNTRAIAKSSYVDPQVLSVVPE